MGHRLSHSISIGPDFQRLLEGGTRGCARGWVQRAPGRALLLPRVPDTAETPRIHGPAAAAAPAPAGTRWQNPHAPA